MKSKPVMQIEEDELRLRVNSEIYPKNAIFEAVEEYTKVCWINIKEKGEEYILTLEPKEKAKDIDFKDIGGSFMNYLIGKVKNG